jgi:HEAT repeat protein
MRNTWIGSGIALFFLAGWAQSVHAYVDRAASLAQLIRESDSIVVVEVSKFNRENGGVILNKIQELKGKTSNTQFKHQLSLGGVTPRYVLEWAEPGQKAVLFIAPQSVMACMGRCWYEVFPIADGWWKLGSERPDLPLAYSGTVSRLIEALPPILAGNTGIITTIPHGANGRGASFDVALNRATLPGLVRLQRVRASLTMGNMAMQVSTNPAYVLGPGSVGAEEIPALVQKLHSPDPVVRFETADDLRTLGPKAAPAAQALASLLDDTAVAPRMSAAAALLCIDPKNEKALKVISEGLSSPQALARRLAARSAGLAGAPAGKFAAKLGALLADADELVRVAALQAITALGPDAATALDTVVKLLDDAASAAGAADALGRMGPAARPAMKRLAPLLASQNELTRWAAARGMSQIGGPDSGPVVDFLIRELQKEFTEWDGYNSMIYLSLLGSDADKAMPTMQRSVRIMPRGLRLYAMWSVQPEKQYPWNGADAGFGGRRGGGPGGFGGGGPGGPGGFGGGGPGGGGPGGPAGFGGGPGGGPGRGFNPDSLVFENLINELGPRLTPHVKVLAEKIVAGTAGNVPNYGYHLLSQIPDPILPILTDALTDKDTAKRQRALTALGNMGPAAASAKDKIDALRSNADDQEKRLLDWSLTQITAARQ